MLFFPETVIAALLTYVLMLAAFYWRKNRKFHVGAMAIVILFDVSMPFYLVTHRDWYERLITGGEILNFLIWMHLGLVITLYALYVMQVQAGRALMKGLAASKESHRAQGMGILLTRSMVIFTGAILYEPEKTQAVVGWWRSTVVAALG